LPISLRYWRLEFRADACRSYREREILRVAVEFGLDRAAQLHAGFDTYRGVAVDQQFHFVGGRTGAIHYEQVGADEFGIGYFGDFRTIDHIC
jgi:hypothetical protein